MHCGSPRVYPLIWVQGFLPTINAERQIYVCRDCGRQGMLLEFDTEAKRAEYAEERRTGRAPANPPPRATDAIPILPIDAVPLAEVRGVAAIPLYRPKVVNVKWTDRRLRRGAYRVDVDEYWDAVGGSQYNAGRLFVLDLAGINHGKPNFDALRFVTKRTDTLLDLGVRRTDDAMDGFMIDVETVVVGTKTLRSLEQFRELYDLSDGMLPCLDYADGVVWDELSREDRDLRVVAAALRKIGFARLAVMDLRRLGTFAGPDPWLLQGLAALDLDVVFGGGLREEDVPRLREAGIRAALIDPFTPVIRGLLPPRRPKPAPTDALPAPERRRDVHGAPAPG